MQNCQKFLVYLVDKNAKMLLKRQAVGQNPKIDENSRKVSTSPESNEDSEKQSDENDEEMSEKSVDECFNEGIKYKYK